MPAPEPTAWVHLPNARHIGGIIVDFAARPWDWYVVQTIDWRVEWSATQEAVQSAEWDVVRTAVQSAVWRAAGTAVPCTPDTIVKYAVAPILALIAWPDSARMLYMTPAALRTLIDITEGNVKHQAVLILPAVLAGYVPT